MAKVKFTDIGSIPSVIAEMTLEEKARMTTGGTSFGATGLERLGIPAIKLLDGAPGINYGQLFGEYAQRKELESQKTGAEKTISGMEGIIATGNLVKILKENGRIDEESLSEAEKSAWSIIKAELNDRFPEGTEPSSFPAGMLLGATWNPEVVCKVGEAAGREFDAYRVDIMLGPNVNIHRDPLAGRLFEGYSEDPRLVERLAPEFIKGVQSTGVAAEPKHFAANSHETARFGCEEHIPERALREIYLPGFRACVREGGTKTIMSAYNKINGAPCALNKWLLTDVLRGEWGFDGLVVSDWGAVYDQVDALKAGNDLEMPHDPSVQAVIDAVNNGTLDEKTLDLAIERQLKCMLELPIMKGRKYTGIDDEHSRRAAYEAACEGIVLLKNENALPLPKTGKVAFMGEKSIRFLDCGAGSAEITTSLTSSLLAGAREKLGAENAVYGDIPADASSVVITAHAKGQEGRDRPAMDLEPEDREMLVKSAAKAKAMGKKVVLVLNIAGPVDMRDYIGSCDAVLCAFLPGREGAHAACDIIFGDVNPSGKLPLTFPVRYQDCPAFGNCPGYGAEAWFGEGIYVGYRWYDARGIKPAFAFGHGLSYAKFELSDLKAKDGVLLTDGSRDAVFTVNVKNTGARSGAEVVQLYIAKPDSTLPKPVKELKAFKKVRLAPGEEKTVEFRLNRSDIESYDPKLKMYTAETGKYSVLVGNACDNITCVSEFTAKGKNPYAYGPNSPFGKVFSDPRCVEVFKRLMGKYVPVEAFEGVMIYSPDKELKDVLERGPMLRLKERLDIFYAEISEFE